MRTLIGMRKISDYKLSKFLIESACEGAGCPFVDLNIRFTDKEQIDALSNNSICISGAKNWFDINSKIVLIYFTHFEQICDGSLMMDSTEMEKVLDLWRSFLLFLCHDEKNVDCFKNDEQFVSRLYQFPIIWLLMKDIICPAYEIQIENVAIATIEDTSSCDISEYLDKDVLEIENSFIGLNGCIEYDPVRDAFLFISVLEAHGLDVHKTIKEIMSSELQSKICGAMKLFYENDKEVNDFLMILLTYVGIENKIEYLVVDSTKKASNKNEMIKEAQFMNNLSNSFWFFGLLEKMLEPSRGTDWSVYKGLNPWFREIQDKIEEEQKKAGRDGVTYESMLRIRSGENTKEENNTILEKNLGSDRVW